LNLYGWDCERTLRLGWAVKNVRAIGLRTFAPKGDDG
jgi:hypothetical protein